MTAPTIAMVARTLCAIFAAPPPTLAAEPALAALADARVDRAVLILADAMGAPVWRTRPDLRARVRAVCPMAIAVRAVFPPKTPVCFASMFTGAQPAQHGIRTYAKPVLTCDTAFDALLRTGRRIALVAVAGSSMDTIFRARAIDYRSEPDDAAVLRTAAQVIAGDRHHLVLAYTQDYDDAVHRLPPLGEEALACAERQVDGLSALAAVATTAWSGRPHAMAFLPDHGAHACAAGHGDHGEDIPDDMELEHFWNVVG